MTTRHVELLATGGTIASHFDGSAWVNLDGATLLSELTELTDSVRVTVRDIESGPSSQLSVVDMLAIAAEIRASIDSGVDGVVVTHGTDTLEITAFLADVVLTGTTPVVFTGSMRPHSDENPDGPRNMTDSITVAASASAVGRGVAVCMGGDIHAPRYVRKLDASTTRAFFSIPFGPVGRVTSGSVEYSSPPVRLPHLDPPVLLEQAVRLVTVYPGMDENELRSAVGDARGVVVEGFGDLNVPMPLWGALHEWSSAGRLVVLASGAHTPTVDSELIEILGVVGSGGLTAQKARVAAMIALSDGRSAEEARAVMKEMGRAR